MRIVCPACQAVYEVPEAAVTASSRVKCAKCQKEWAPTVAPALEPPAPVATIAAPTFVPPEPARPSPAVMGDEVLVGGAHRRVRLAADGEPSETPTGALLAWAATLIILIGLGWAGYNWRVDVMHMWPASTRLYAALGLSAPPL